MQNKFSSYRTKYTYIYFSSENFGLNFFKLIFFCCNNFKRKGLLGQNDFPRVAVEFSGFWTLVGYNGSRLCLKKNV